VNIARKTISLAIAVLVCLTAMPSTVANGCPFCAAVTQTFNEEISSMDTVVYARLVKLPPPLKPGNKARVADEVPKATFEVSEIIKGAEHLKSTRLIETIYFGEGKIGSTFLVMGVDPPQVMWSTPLQLSERAQGYIKRIISLPRNPTERLTFFQDYLEDNDEMLAADAYDEFANAPYTVVKSLKAQMDHGKITSWIRDPDIPASRRRLYLTLLGVCGTSNDLPMLETMMKSKDRRMRAGLDALVACYLTLKGPDGMPLVENLFIKNRKSEYADTYAAIMALRFHGTETDIIPRDRILKAMRHMLERPQLADLVIPDLARWEDWSQVDRLTKLFKDADEKTSWVRVPVINYLRQCPLPLAKERIKELEKVDPAAVKRANTFFPFGPAGGTPSKKPATPPKTSSGESNPSEVFVTTRPQTKLPADDGGRVVFLSKPEAGEQTARQPTLQIPLNSSHAFIVPWLVAAGLLLMQWMVLIGPSHHE
jgi:hypothetical protein